MTSTWAWRAWPPVEPGNGGGSARVLAIDAAMLGGFEPDAAGGGGDGAAPRFVATRRAAPAASVPAWVGGRPPSSSPPRATARHTA